MARFNSAFTYESTIKENIVNYSDVVDIMLDGLGKKKRDSTNLFLLTLKVNDLSDNKTDKDDEMDEWEWNYQSVQEMKKEVSERKHAIAIERSETVLYIMNTLFTNGEDTPESRLKNVFIIELSNFLYRRGIPIEDRVKPYAILHMIINLENNSLESLKQEMENREYYDEENNIEIKYKFESYKGVVNKYKKPFRNHLYIEPIYDIEDVIHELIEKYGNPTWCINYGKKVVFDYHTIFGIKKISDIPNIIKKKYKLTYSVKG